MVNACGVHVRCVSFEEGVESLYTAQSFGKAVGLTLISLGKAHSFGAKTWELFGNEQRN
jgi:hypothetical protein